MSLSLSNEYIYNLLPKDTSLKLPKITYRSTRRKDIENEYREKLEKPFHQHKTFGLAKEDIPSPQDYLKKFSKRLKNIPKDDKKFNWPEESRRPRPPRYDEVKSLEPFDTKNVTNYINKNAVDVLLKKKTQPKRITVDQRNGHKIDLDPPKSHPGVEKRFVLKDEYGKLPQYLTGHREFKERAKETLELYKREKKMQNSPFRLTDEDKEEMIKGLKENWDRVFGEYVKLPVMIDTIKCKRQKSQLEKEMDQLQYYIKLLQSSAHVFITED